MSPCDRLFLDERTPVEVHEDDLVGSGDVESDSSGSTGASEREDVSLAVQGKEEREGRDGTDLTLMRRMFGSRSFVLCLEGARDRSGQR